MRNRISRTLSTITLLSSGAFSLALATPQVFQIESSFHTPGENLIQQHTLGFAIESEGYILSAYEPLIHPKTGDLSNKLSLVSAPEQEIQIVGVEPTMGFAILKVDSEEPIELYPLHIERDLEAGDFIAAYSFDFSDNLLERHEGLFTQMNTLDCYQQSLTGTMFRADIDIPESGLGSPLFNADGEIFAIHTGYTPVDEVDEANDDKGIYLLPMSLAMIVYDGVKLRGNDESPWTGFSVRHLNDAEKASYPQYGGRIKGAIAIDYIWEGSTAEELGIQRGDQLVKFGHYPIETVGDFQKWLYLYGVGQEIKLYFLRDEELISFNYTIEARPSWAQPK